MSAPAALAAAVADVTGRAVTAVRPVPGGDINEAFAVELAGGGRAFVKTRSQAPRGEYAAEAAGLRWLGAVGALRVPAVLAVGDDEHGPRFLALEWLEQGGLTRAGEEELGRGLAAVHAAGAPGFGGEGALRLGSLLLPNEPTADWASFYAQRRLRPLLEPATSRGALSSGAAAAVERLCERLDELAGPPEPPARLHGDLWAGNVLADAAGRPWLIDPAAHGGHRELDLAMLELFGTPGRAVLPAYREVAPPADGYEDRRELWQLCPLLVHAVLFGGHYGAAAERVARRYAG
jgi:fructosamine-3-kinase